MNIDDMFPSRFLRASQMPLTLTVKSVDVEAFDDGDAKPVIWFSDHKQGLLLNKTNSNSIRDLYGSDTDAWIGKQISLVEAVTDFQGKRVKCIRIGDPVAPPPDGEQPSFRAQVMRAFTDRGITKPNAANIVRDYLEGEQVDTFNDLTPDRQLSLLQGIKNGAYDQFATQPSDEEEIPF